MYQFQCDYTGGCLPEILKLLTETNNEELPGYCEDQICKEASSLLLNACSLTHDQAEVFWLPSGTLANLSVLTTVLRSNESVIASEDAHIFTAEAGAVEAHGHKIETSASKDGKIQASLIEKLCTDYLSHDPIGQAHLTRPAAVYLAFPSEFGTVYSLEGLRQISSVCRKYGLFLYVDGARLAYGLSVSDAALSDLAQLSDAFYIGGTKCGALIGEAVVIKDAAARRRFLGTLRMCGGLLAKGRLVGAAFKAFFTDDLYFRVGKEAVDKAQRIQKAFTDSGVEMYIDSPTNQIFPLVNERQLSELSKCCRFKVLKRTESAKYLLRFCTSWSTEETAVQLLVETIKKLPR